MSTSSIETSTNFTQSQLDELRKPLDKRLISERKGGRGKVKYLEGHVVIDQADRIFGYGNWGYKPLSLEQVVIHDPLTGEAVGVQYEAVVELVVHGCEPIVDVGSQPVAVWNVEDHVTAKRIGEADAKHTQIDLETPPTWAERKVARTALMDAHENARKGAMTDGLKRCLRAYGEQFGNSSYGDGTKTQQVSRPATAEQLKRLGAWAAKLNHEIPGDLTEESATTLLRQWYDEYQQRKKAS